MIDWAQIAMGAMAGFCFVFAAWTAAYGIYWMTAMHVFAVWTLVVAIRVRRQNRR